MIGLMVTVLRPAHGDCSNGGVSSKHSVLWLVDQRRPFRNGLEVPQDAIDDGTVLFVDAVGGNWDDPQMIHARPPCPEGKWQMFGGNYVVGDSRFSDRFVGPLRVHDRIE